MSTLILTFVVITALFTIMAIGVLFGRAPIAGSCGGMKALGMEMECEICGGDPARCDESEGPSRGGADSAGAETAARLSHNADQRPD